MDTFLTYDIGAGEQYVPAVSHIEISKLRRHFGSFPIRLTRRHVPALRVLRQGASAGGSICFGHIIEKVEQRGSLILDETY